MRLVDWPTETNTPKEHHHMTVTLRWLFAVVAIASGLYLLINSHGDRNTVVIGVGLVCAGIAPLVP